MKCNFNVASNRIARYIAPILVIATNQPTNQPTSQPTNQPTNHAAKEWNIVSTPKWYINLIMVQFMAIDNRHHCHHCKNSYLLSCLLPYLCTSISAGMHYKGSSSYFDRTDWLHRFGRPPTASGHSHIEARWTNASRRYVFVVATATMPPSSLSLAMSFANTDSVNVNGWTRLATLATTPFSCSS